jgi:hypothetical protein
MQGTRKLAADLSVKFLSVTISRSKRDFMGDYVYKYRSFSKMHLQALFENKIWFSQSETFNDPFDSSHNTFLNKSDLHSMLELMQRVEPEKAGYYQNIIDTQPNQLVHMQVNSINESGELDLESTETEQPFKFMTDMLSKAYIFCACKTATNNLMWSHYGDYHKGFCIRYKKSVLEKLNLFKHDDVKYEPQRVNIANVANGLGSITNEVLEQSFIKGEDWKYEEEYRFVLNNDDQNNALSIPIVHNENAVDMILFGIKTSESDKAFIKSLLKGRDIKFKNLKVNESGFSLSVIP